MKRSFIRWILSLPLLFTGTLVTISCGITVTTNGEIDPNNQVKGGGKYEQIKNVISLKKERDLLYPDYRDAKTCKLLDKDELQQRKSTEGATHFDRKEVKEFLESQTSLYKQKIKFPPLKEGEEVVKDPTLRNYGFFMNDSGYAFANLIDEKDTSSVEAYARMNPLKNQREDLSDYEINKNLWNRSFSIGFLGFCNFQIGDAILYGNSDDNLARPILSGGYGTGWLLDYAKKKDGNKYKLFIATNLHVSEMFKYKGEFDPNNYKYGIKDYGNKTNMFFIGRSLGVDFKPKNLLTRNNPVTYYTNIPDKKWNFTSKNSIHVIVEPEIWTKVLKNPKIFFAAVNFMSKKAMDSYSDLWKLRFDINKNKLKRLELQPLKQKEFLHYRDFAVLELDYDEDLIDSFIKKYSKFPKIVEDLKRYKDWIRSSMGEVDRIVRTAKERNFTNKDNFSDNFFSSLDEATIFAYTSLEKYDNLEKKLNGEIFVPKQKIKNTSTILLAGYPSYLGVSKISNLFPSQALNWRQINQVLWDFQDRGNPDLQQIRDNFSFLDNQSEGVFLLNFRDKVLHPVSFDYYLEFSGLRGGSSGSSVYTLEGLPVAIHWGGIPKYYGDLFSLENNVEISSPLNQEKDITAFALRYVKDSSGKVRLEKVPIFKNYAYNLIDNTGYPMQELSFRGALNKHYPNGVFNDGVRKTAIFEDYKMK